MASDPGKDNKPFLTVDDPDGEGSSIGAIFDCLASTQRRRLLGVLYDQTQDSLTRRELATYLVSGYQESTREKESDAVQRTVGELHHNHLPKLETAGLVDRDLDRSTVRITDHPAFEDPGIVDVIEGAASASPESLDALFRALTHFRRRTILDVLSHQYGPIHLETLAQEIGAKEGDTVESSVSEETVERILGSLHHKHLPRLVEAELIDVDTDEGTIEYRGHPALRVPWMHSVFHPDFRAGLTGEAELQEIGTIDRREQVISFGQSLCDRADEELFCMFTDVDLLEAGCLTRIRDASQRGVNVYLGTPDSDIQEYVQENAPEVILWEPKMNWLNLPIAGNRVGRLLLSDREAVMLGTLKEATRNGVHEERAIIGEGTDNVLVVMVAQILSPYLERIDEETEDFTASLPF